MAEQGQRFEVDGVLWEWFWETPGFRCEFGECERNAEVLCCRVEDMKALAFCTEHATKWSGGQIDLEEQ